MSRKLGTSRVIDLSATPFFLSGSGYAEGTLFPWTMCDFSLMDAIECGIVKLPRVPVADNVPGNEMPMYRELWKHIRTRMPKQGRGKAGALNPLSLPAELRTALDALYGHYEETFGLWEEAKISVPPCFIVVCNNIAASKLVYDYVSGFYREREDGSKFLENGRLELFRNFDQGWPAARPSPHPPHPERATRVRRCARLELSQDGCDRDSSDFGERSSSGPGTAVRPRTSATRNCFAKS